MKFKGNKYDVFKRVKKKGILFLLVLAPLLLTAQNDEKADTVPGLKYELDTADSPQLPDEEPPAEEIYKDVQNDVAKEEAEYFLRKEFTGGFSDSLQLRRLPDSALQQFRDDEAFWYANETFKRKQKKQGKGFTSHPVFQTILWLVIIGGFATFLAMYLSGSNVRLFRKNRNIAKAETNIDTDDIFAISYQQEIDKAISSNNYRLAVRLMFLQLLKNLSDSNIIQYTPDSTNFDYLVQLQSTGMYHEFFKLTRHYEYTWYGQFKVDKDKFTIIKKEFDRLTQKIK